ncbi:hypothetical protein D6D01_05898 [Aureobasidium pullulans]|uniref:Uncharacterized protein n=1 Tax=Aureobasidium pullulans TaxID=5580 RepID=A0A4S9L464_AURPU|nr:hypothetical protein D6D01_05898 [Aureobasidium pullulans]
MATTFETSSFLIELPQELKDMIYDYVLFDYAILLGDSPTSLPHPLIRTSKQLRAEARVPFIRALARSADRIFRAGIETWEDKFTACSIAWIEDLLLAIRDTWIEAGSKSYVDPRRHDLIMQGYQHFP